MSFPQFYLHYSLKEDKTLLVDRSEKLETEVPFVISIPLQEELTRKLLNGELSSNDIIVNKYATPPYALDKTQFPVNAKYHFVFDSHTQQIEKIITKEPDFSELSKDSKYAVKIDGRIAYSVLCGDTNFSDWEIKKNDEDALEAVFSPKSGVHVSSLFKNRIDFLSLSELVLTSSKPYEKNEQRLCEIDVDHLTNSMSIKCADVDKKYFNEFFLAVTNKNDPSYLLKLITFEPNSTTTVNFDGKLLSDMSFFSSRYHLRNTEINVRNCFSGMVYTKIFDDRIEICNTLSFGESLPEVSLILRNKYDKTKVYRTIKLKDNTDLIFALNGLDPSLIEIDTVKISKKVIHITREHK